MAASGAQIVRQMELAAIRAFLVIDRLQRIMLRRMLRFEGEVFLLGTAILAPVPFQVRDVASTVPMVNGRIGRGPRRPVCPLCRAAPL